MLLTPNVSVLFSQIVLYLRMCLAYSAGATPLSIRLADMQDDAPAIGRYVHTLLSSEHQPSLSKGSETNPVHVYMDLLQQLLSAVGGERTCSIIRTITTSGSSQVSIVMMGFIEDLRSF